MTENALLDQKLQQLQTEVVQREHIKRLKSAGPTASYDFFLLN